MALRRGVLEGEELLQDFELGAGEKAAGRTPIVDSGQLDRCYHDVLFWGLVLRKKRRDRGRPLPEPLEQNLIRLATRLSRTWSVNLRYSEREVSTHEAKTVCEDVAWFEGNRFQLWS